jgi:DNA topoisomerase-1
VPDEVSSEVCDVCGRQMVVKSGRFGRFLACPGYPECTFTKPIVVEMPGKCPRCGSRILKKTSKRGFAYYACEKGAACGFMTWDVPVADNCPSCGQTMFKLSGRGSKKPFCINEACENFLPEDKRGYKRKPAAAKTDGQDGEQAAGEAEKKPARAKKAASKSSAAKKTTAKKAAPKKTAGKKAPAKKTAAKKSKTSAE